jgi:electron transfer flavoprotein alpha subunit
MMPTPVVVWSERPELRRELLGQARRVADNVGAEVHLCLTSGNGSSAPEPYGAHGADMVYQAVTDLKDPERLAAFVAQVVSESRPGLVIVGATKTGMEVAPRLAERCNAAYAAWAVGMEIASEDGAVSASCMLYAGTAVATYRFKRSVTVLSVAQGVFEAVESGRGAVPVRSIVPEDGGSGIKVIGERAKNSSGARLQGARSVVDVGRGVKSTEELGVARSLAALLDAQLSCSRPVSSDRDWFPDWLGLSGAKVKPELCLTLGVSGAVQHIVGIRDSRVIAAVNIDENAAIFTQADIGIVADLKDFLPVLIDRLRSRGVRPAWTSAA